MTRYYFDIRDERGFAPDDEGLELPSLQAVQEEAARSLADLARDGAPRLHDGAGDLIAVEVRDENGPVLKAQFTYVSPRSH